MENTIQIRTRDGYVINGTLTTPNCDSASHMVIFVHGLFGRQTDHIFYNAGEVFAKESISTFRFDFYGETKDARRFGSTTLAKCAEDLKTVIDYFKTTFEKISLVGHSLGSVVILLCDLSPINRIVFWDPSLDASVVFGRAQYSICLDTYIFDHGFQTLIDSNTIAAAQTIPPVGTLIRKMNKPIKIIVAEKGGFQCGRQIYFDNANFPKDFCVIRNANHSFDEKESERTLFRETLSWIGRTRADIKELHDFRDAA